MLLLTNFCLNKITEICLRKKIMLPKFVHTIKIKGSKKHTYYIVSIQTILKAYKLPSLKRKRIFFKFKFLWSLMTMHYEK